MRAFPAVLSSILLIPFAHAQTGPQSIRLCVSTLENVSRLMVTPKWQQSQLIKAFERINKSKDVVKGKAARIDTVALESTDQPDPNVRDNDCEFVLHTTLTDVQKAGVPRISVPPPTAIEVGSINVGDRRAYPPDYNNATVTYRIIRNGNPKAWSSGIVTAQDAQSDEVLVTQLMDQIAKRVASELRKSPP